MATKLTFLTLLSVFAAVLHSANSICHLRDYGHDGAVCVCSETQKCDDGDFPGLKFDAGVVTGIRSNRAGDRFTPKTYHFATTSKAVANTIKVTLDPTKKYQKIFGFGASFTDSTGTNVHKLPKAMQDQIMHDFWSDKGFGYTMARIPIGGSDFSPRAYTLDDHENDDTLEKFALQPEDFNLKIPLIKQASELSHNKMKYFGSAWTPPIWMKTNHKFNNGGLLKGDPGTKYWKLYAQYLVKFIQEYEKQHVPIWGITVNNEPGQGYVSNYGINSLAMNSTLQRDFIKFDLGPELDKHGYQTKKLMILDDNVGKMKEFASDIMNDHEAGKHVAGVAFHWYANGGSGQIPNLDFIAQKFPQLFLLNTEACPLSSHTQLGNWKWAEAYAQDIINDLNHHTSGWVEWNMALNTHGGPNGGLDSSLIINETHAEYYKQPSYYAMGSFSKFILPDSVRIHHDVAAGGHNDFLVTVFERPDSMKVAVALNKGTSAVHLELHDPKSGYLEVELPPRSIESYVWH